MTTQVIKTSSKIVKAVAAAVLFTACTQITFADTNKTNEFANTTAETIKNAQADLMKSLNKAISDATGIEDVNSHLDFSVQYGAEFKSQAEAAVKQSQVEIIAASSKTLLSELNYVIEDSTPVFVSVDSESLLPSITALTDDYETKMSQIFNTAISDTMSFAISYNPLSDNISSNLE